MLPALVLVLHKNGKYIIGLTRKVNLDYRKQQKGDIKKYKNLQNCNKKDSVLKTRNNKVLDTLSIKFPSKSFTKDTKNKRRHYFILKPYNKKCIVII